MIECIIYGAGVGGANALRILNSIPEYSVKFFIDGNPQKHGRKFYGLDIYSAEILKNQEYRKYRIIISMRDNLKVLDYLNELGYKDVIILSEFTYDINSEGKKLYNSLNINRCIDLGKFLSKWNDLIKIPQLPYVDGESSALDYAFLLTIAKVFKCKKYFEIGTYIGTSINVMSSICEWCGG